MLWGDLVNSPHTPIDLPRHVAVAIGPAITGYLDELNLDGGRVLAESIPWWLHWGPGVLVRNLVRRYSVGWTDQELDDCWPAVLRRAGRAFREASCR